MRRSPGCERALVTLETYRLLPSSILRALWKSCRVPAASDASRESWKAGEATLCFAEDHISASGRATDACAALTGLGKKTGAEGEESHIQGKSSKESSARPAR